MKNRFLIVLLLFSSYIHAQDKTKAFNITKLSNSQTDSLDRANILFDEENYLSSLPYFLHFSELYPNELAFKYKIGICYLSKADEKEKALKLLSEVAEKNKKAENISFYLGKALHLNYKFDEAIEQFNNHLQKKDIPSVQKEEIQHLIENCNNGKDLVANPVTVQIENIGSVINTKYSEYVPLISSDQQMLIYTYRGEKSTGGLQNDENLSDPYGSYHEDIFISEKDTNYNWTEPRSIGDNINGPGHDACIALSPDGQKLFIYKISLEDSGDIYMSDLEGKEWSSPKKLEGDVNTNYWEGSASLSADEKTLYFSSERPGGFGGRDIYKATLQTDGKWGNVVNLGPKVNTPYDEDAPFIHPNGRLFLYSSKGHKSMGGYDIFYSDLVDSAWGEADNMGYPINTTDDDIYYVLSADTRKGYYSSGKAGGYGLQDIYTLYPGLPGRRAPLILLTGIVNLNDQPTKADVIVTYLDDNKDYGTYHSNSSSGKYLVNLQEGTSYKITYKLTGMPDQTQIVNSMKVNPFFQTDIDIDFYTEEYKKAKEAAEAAQREKEEASNAKEYTVLLGIYNKELSKKLLSKFLKISDITTTNPDDSTTIYTVGKYDNYSSAEKRKNKFVKDGIKDARVIYKQNGKFVDAGYSYSSTSSPDNSFSPDQLLSKYGNMSAKGLKFKVQIGAFRAKPEKSLHEKLRSFGKIEEKNSEDGYIRCTIGTFSTLNEANSIKKVAIERAGIRDAFIIAYYKGDRISFKELVKSNFYQE